MDRTGGGGDRVRARALGVGGLVVPLLLIAAASLGAGSARGEDAAPQIKLADGRFEPSQLVVPAGVAFQLRVINTDKTAIEFESFELHRERVVQPGEAITVYLPALEPGSYPFFDDFHRDTPEGAIVAK